MVILVICGFLTAMLITFQVRNVSKGKLFRSFVGQFLISFTYSFSIKIIADATDSLFTAGIYALSTACGAVTGLLIDRFLFKKKVEPMD